MTQINARSPREAARIEREDVQRIIELLTREGLEVKKLDEQEGKRTPDLIAHAGGKLAFYCEVKSILEDSWLEDLVSKAPEGMLIPVEEKNDSTHSRITTKVHEAAAQFRSVNPEGEHPNILAIVNHDTRYSDFRTLRRTVTGKFYTDEGKGYPICCRYSEGRIKDEKREIDLYLWVEHDKIVYCLFAGKDNKAYADLCAYLGLNPKEIEEIPQPKQGRR